MVGQEQTPVESDAEAPRVESWGDPPEQTERMPEQPSATQQADARASRSRGAGRYLILFGVFLIAVMAAYGLGLRQERQAELSVQQNLTADVERLQTQVADLSGEVLMLEARRRLHVALMALDRRNFGTAQQYLVAAGKDLALIKGAPAGSDPAVLTRLAQEFQSARLVATADFGHYRDRILGWAHELDSQFPTELAATVAPAPETGAGQPEIEATGRPPLAPSAPGEASQARGAAGEMPVAAGAAPGDEGPAPGTPAAAPAAPGTASDPAVGAPPSPSTSPQPPAGTPGLGGTGPGTGAAAPGAAPTPATGSARPARTGSR